MKVEQKHVKLVQELPLKVKSMHKLLIMSERKSNVLYVNKKLMIRS